MKQLLAYKALPMYFFGLFKKVVKENYTVSMFQSLSSHTRHWDYLILTKTKFK